MVANEKGVLVNTNISMKGEMLLVWVSQQVEFHNKLNRKDIKPFVVMSLILGGDERHVEYRVRFYGGEDLTKIFKQYFAKDWEALFPPDIVKQGIFECEIEGISVEGLNSVNNDYFSMDILNGFNRLIARHVENRDSPTVEINAKDIRKNTVV